MSRSDSYMHSSLEEDQVTVGQLDAGEQFWLDGSIWETRAMGYGKMVLCKRLGHAEEVWIDVNVVIQPKK